MVWGTYFSTFACLTGGGGSKAIWAMPIYRTHTFKKGASLIKRCQRNNNSFFSDDFPENAQQHVRCQPGRLRPDHDDDDGFARDCQRVYTALLDVGQVEQDDRRSYLLIRKALVRRLRFHRRCDGNLFDP